VLSSNSCQALRRCLRVAASAYTCNETEKFSRTISLMIQPRTFLSMVKNKADRSPNQ
jgi:hypothetical protein